jgi:2-polyprenyl-3-methyl-5-hydroxy-6-metoxy-1,4-benzoquinol methylase
MKSEMIFSLLKIACPICEEKAFSHVTIRPDSGNIVCCLNCGHIYLNPPIKDNLLSEVFEKYYIYHNDEAFMEIIERWFADPAGPYQYVLKFILTNKEFSGKNVLEVGCGAGRFLAECRKYDANVVGVDPSLTAARLAKKYFNLNLVSKTLRQAIEDGDLSFSQFDFIFAFEVIEHVKRPGDFLLNLSQLLKPTGLLFISTPNFGLFYQMGNAARAVAGYFEHLHYFTCGTLTDCLRRYNLQPVAIVTTNMLNYGDRQKIILSENRLISFIWKAIRRITFISALKNVIFKQLAKHKEAIDLDGDNGNNIVSICRRQ